MPGSSVTLVAAEILLEGVTDVTHTDIVQDESDGKYVRVWRFFGTAPGEGNAPLVYTVRARSDAQNMLEITTKPLQV